MATVVSTARHDDPLVLLFVEDHDDTRQMYGDYFTGCGFIVELVGTGRDAVARARAIVPDVIVADITLPDMDGFEVCRALKREPATCAIPVIAATGYWRPDAIERAKEAGFASFLLKPYTPDRLRDEVLRVALTAPASACPLRTPNLRWARRSVRHRT